MEWVGPANKIWSDRQCNNVGNFNNITLDECKDRCRSTKGCTAFNRRPDRPGETQGCALRACSLPVAPPKWNYLNDEGYYLVPRKMKTQLDF